MKHRISTLLAVAALVGTASAFAANPFSDVPKDSWAYQAVSQLAGQGVVIGFPDGTFRGEQNLTRYEMAEIIARMMAHEDALNAEQRAVVNQLAQEFATELNNLGVRVAGLEQRVGNVKITGDARIKYESKDAEKVYVYSPTAFKLFSDQAEKKLVYEVQEGYNEVEPDAFINNPELYISNNNAYPVKTLEDAVYAGWGYENAAAAKAMTAEQLKEKEADVTKKMEAVTAAKTALAEALKKNPQDPQKNQLEQNIKTAEVAYDQSVAARDLYDLAVNHKAELEAIAKAAVAAPAQKSDAWNYRLRLKAEARVGAHTWAGARFVMKNDFGVGADSKAVEFDRLWVSHMFGPVYATAGRINGFLGDGLVFDSTLDGAIVSTTVEGVDFTAGYGYPVKVTSDSKASNTLTFAQLGSKLFDKVNVKVYGVAATSNKTGDTYLGFKHNVYGVAASTDFGNFTLNAEYARRNTGKNLLLLDGQGKDAWMVGGAFHTGAWNFALQYFHQGVNSPILASTYDQRYAQNWKGLVGTVGYQFSQNVDAQAVYTWKGDVVEKYNGAIVPSASYYAQLNFRF